jgi:hypothetical protein
MNTETLRNVVFRIVTFDYKGFIWKIELSSEEADYQKLVPGFQHFLDTFEFLPQYSERIN